MIEPYKELVNGHEFWMIPVEGGNFLMGSPEDDAERDNDERPQHEVAVADFHIGKFPVTQALWKAVMNGENPSYFQGDDRPVEQVSWDDAQAFIKKLNDLTESSRPQGHVYRLPSEAEWEYAARGGKYHGEGYKYAGSDRLKDVGWFDENSGKESKPVGLKYPNQLGLYDMSGNVWEWCEDDWHNNYEGTTNNDSGWVNRSGWISPRGYRGGCWSSDARTCRVAYNILNWQADVASVLGFRLALTPQ